MAARSVQVVICNLTNSELFLSGLGLQHGKWSSKPPLTIAPMAINTQFGSQSHGFLTGTQGSASYAIGSPTGNGVALEWDNPFVGSNSYSATAPGGFACPWLGGQGNNATIYFVLYQPLAVDWMQANMPTLQNNSLRQLCIPGSHDSGMSTLGAHTFFSRPCNTLTQTEDIAGQLLMGARYFDLRPVLSNGEFYTGHYSKELSITYQGGNGQSIASIIIDINTFMTGLPELPSHSNAELVILNLSHDLNTDLGNASYAPFTQGDWDRLLLQMSTIENLFVAGGGESNGPPAGGDLSVFTFNGQIHVCYLDSPNGGMNHQTAGSWIWDASSPSGLPVGWQLQQLTGTGDQTGGGGYAAGGPVAVAFNSQIHVCYFDGKGQIWDVWSTDGTTGSWQAQQLTGPGSPLAAASQVAGSLAAMAFNGQMHVCYLDSSGLIWNVWSTDGMTWRLQPPLSLTGPSNFAGSPFAMAFNSQMHVCCLDSSGLIWDISSPDGMTWQFQPLTGPNTPLPNAPQLAGSLAAMAFKSQMHVCCLDSSGLIWDISSPDGMPGSWQLQQLTGSGGKTHGPSAAGSPAAAAFHNHLHVCYRDDSGLIWDARSHDGTSWHLQELAGPGSPPLVLAPPAASDPVIGIAGTQMHVCYKDATGIIQDVYVDSSSPLSFNIQPLNGPDLTLLPLKNFIGGGQAAVIVVVDPGRTGISLGSHQNQGFFRAGSFPVYNQYSATNGLGGMESDQLNKMQLHRSSPDGDYFLLSWTLTQSSWQATTCSTSILDLANQAKGPLYGMVVPACSAKTFPNILYADDISISAISNLAMTINTTFAI
jgi:hypothetical protein